MMNIEQNREKSGNEYGFSLVELIIVIAIMAILVGVLAPQYIKYVEKARVSADEDTANSILNACCAIITDNDYIDNISSGTKIYYSISGVSINGDANSQQAIGNALDEYFGEWSVAKVKSKTYHDLKMEYVFAQNAKGIFVVQSDWVTN